MSHCTVDLCVGVVEGKPGLQPVGAIPHMLSVVRATPLPSPGAVSCVAHSPPCGVRAVDACFLCACCKPAKLVLPVPVYAG